MHHKTYISSLLPHRPTSMEDSIPPFQETYKALLHAFPPETSLPTKPKPENRNHRSAKLPLIDLSPLDATADGRGRAKCMNDLAEVSRDWGFFQVVNHGVPRQILEALLREERRVFRQPFRKKAYENILDLRASDGCYRWGNRAATSAAQLPWSEAFHVPVALISSGMGDYEGLRVAAEVFASKVGGLAQNLAEILALSLGVKTTFFHENFSASTSFLRMTRYPPCPIPSEVFGLIPHTDTNFLTLLYQDQVGGLQLEKDGQWFSIQPNPEALIVNIGDFFQAWSNGVYKSVKHRVVLADGEVERLSAAYFYCPCDGTMIQSCIKPPIYRAFTSEEYREQTQRDVKDTGDKVGLSRFLL